MRSFQDTFETRKRSFIGAFPICMTVPLIYFSKNTSNLDLSVFSNTGIVQNTSNLGLSVFSNTGIVQDQLINF